MLAVAQEVKLIVYSSEGWWFNLWLIQLTCISDTEPTIGPDDSSIFVLLMIDSALCIELFTNVMTFRPVSVFYVHLDHSV